MFIVFEGIDGAGKSSHIPRVAKILEEAGVEVVLTREPGGTPLGESIRSLALHEVMHPETELLLMSAARKEHAERVIKPALERGAVVISDRYIGSSYAFQGGGRGVPKSLIDVLVSASNIPLPDKTLIFDLPTEVAKQRMEGRALDKFETEGEVFSRNVRAAYMRMVDEAENKESFTVIDSSKPFDEVCTNVDAVFQRLSEELTLKKKVKPI